MISLLNKFIFLNILKWKITGDVPTDKKLIFAVGPHTSAYDFFVGLFFRSHLKMENQIKFIGKAELFQIPIFGLFLRSIGGIPVIRNKSNNSVDYLSTFKDTFCCNTKQSNWTKRISKKRWSSFLSDKYGVLEEDYGDLIYNFRQIDRKAFYIHPSLGIPLRDLRKEFKLKSTFFSSRIDGNDVLLNGYGFGHGVGLCQEGAMKMADLGYDYKQIASYYYSNIRIINFFKNRSIKQKKILH